MLTSYSFGVVLLTVVACNAQAPSTANEIKITGNAPPVFPTGNAGRATCGNFDIKALNPQSPSLTGDYVLTKVTPMTQSFSFTPIIIPLNTCSPLNFLKDNCKGCRVSILDNDPLSMTFSVFSDSTKTTTSHVSLNVAKLGLSTFPLYQSQITAMEQETPSSRYITIFPIPAIIQITQDSLFAIITSDDDRAWIAFVTCSVFNPIVFVLVKKDAITDPRQFGSIENAYNQALTFSGIDTKTMIDIPVSNYTPPSALDDAALGINTARLTAILGSTSSPTSASPSTSPTPPTRPTP